MKRKLLLMLALFVGIYVAQSQPCTHSIKLTDSYGDGWDGAYLDVEVNGVVVLDDITVSYYPGDTETYMFSAATGDNIDVIYTSGSFESEHSYIVYDGGGLILGQSGPYPGSISVTGNCPSCFPPTNLNVSGETTSTADLSWGAASGATGYNWEVVPYGNGQGVGVVSSGSTAGITAMATGLSAGTAYDAYVQSDCGSSYDGPVTFSTAGTCGLWSIQLYDTYGDGWNGGEVTVYVNGSPFLTSLTITSGYGPESYSFGVNIGDVVSTDYTSGSFGSENEYKIFNESSTEVAYEGAGGTTPGDVTDLEACESCPDPSALTVTNITASSVDLGWTDNAGTSFWDIELGLAGFTPSGIPTESGVSNPYTYDGLTEVTDYEWYVRADCGDGDYSDWEGPVSFSTPPACPQPTDQVTTGITTTTADLGWTDNAGATTWDIELGPAGFTPTGTPTEYYVSNPFTYPGLTENTDYDWYVRANCGGAPTGPHALGDYSEWTGPHSFSTACNALMTFPFYEGFENGGLIPDCWTIEYVEGTKDWTYEDGGGDSFAGRIPPNAYVGSYNALFYHESSSTPVTTKLISPPMDLSTATFPHLIFWHAQAIWAGDQDELKVYYKTSAAGSWTLIPGAVISHDVPVWTPISFALPEPSAEYYIAFEATGQYGHGVTIDEVRVEASPPVPVSDWAVYIAIFLITIAIWFRFRSRI